jgi:hypothetical protein
MSDTPLCLLRFHIPTSFLRRKSHVNWKYVTFFQLYCRFLRRKTASNWKIRVFRWNLPSKSPFCAKSHVVDVKHLPACAQTRSWQATAERTVFDVVMIFDVRRWVARSILGTRRIEWLFLGCCGGFGMKRPTASPHPTPTQPHGIYSCLACEVGSRARRVCAAVPVTIANTFIASTTSIISQAPPAPRDRRTYLARTGKRVAWTYEFVR